MYVAGKCVIILNWFAQNYLKQIFHKYLRLHELNIYNKTRF